MSANVRYAVGVLPVLTLSLLAAGCDQPSPKCGIQRGQFAATYTLVSGNGDCSTLKGEVLNIGVYSPAGASNAPPDPNRVIVGVQPQSLADYLGGAAGVAEPNPEDRGYALGEFSSSKPNDADFCVVPSFSNPARVRLPEIPEQTEMCTTTPAQPALDVTYEWSDLRVYATAGAYGTQFAARLRYKNGDCVAEYAVTAVYPVISCMAMPPESDGSPATGDDGGAPIGAGPDAFVPQGLDASADMDAAGSQADAEILDDPASDDATCPAPDEADNTPPMVDDALCTPAATAGLGLNPDFATRCDPDLMLCVLSKEPPSLR